MRIHQSGFIGLILFGLMFSPLPAYTYYGAHLTSQPPWLNRIDVYNNDVASGSFNLKIWDTQGQQVLDLNYSVPANGVVSVVMPTQAGYLPGPEEIVLDAVEGTCIVTSDSERIRPKLSFRYGDSLSLCEFFLQSTLGWEYVLPNTIQEHFIGTGLAVMNPGDSGLAVRLQAFLGGAKVGDTGQVEIAPHTKLVSISEGFWPGVGSDDFDMVRISSNQAAFPTPMSISWDQLNDRHVFFNAEATALTWMPQPGDLVDSDPIVGDLVYVPAGTFLQGSPLDEPCRYSNEAQFTHHLSRDIAVMATEITRGMWAELQAVQPTLPNDPTFTSHGSGPDNPVQHVSWYKAILFANLLSVERGLKQCYYRDADYTLPLTRENYTWGGYYCDFSANGYRLLTEGEWEYMCRAGTTTLFWIAEPDYSEENCQSGITIPGTWRQLETVAWFCANEYEPAGYPTTKPVGLKLPNPWGLYDTYGNVGEWCWDWVGSYPPESVEDYAGASSGSYRVTRGGGFNSLATWCRSAFRSVYVKPTDLYSTVGFRLARSLIDSGGHTQKTAIGGSTTTEASAKPQCGSTTLCRSSSRLE